ncbi:hypothetical protein M9H77_19123 [Catharanthus roseus]|uniref:Uncharacterized protein n=1 Tax=Catharanthus roseus TaxID=4058 RepID=A0ACC0B9E8_CATRO|nr:hypothetical protein M9H77_19123 [Catharanthus roseus]
MLWDGTTTLGRARRALKLSLVWPVIWEKLLWNRALVWCLVGIDYEMPELDFHDLVLGSEPYPWSPTVALDVSLNLGVEAVLICLDLLRFPSCAPNPHVGSSISVVKINLGRSWAQQAAEGWQGLRKMVS